MIRAALLVLFVATAQAGEPERVDVRAFFTLQHSDPRVATIDGMMPALQFFVCEGTAMSETDHMCTIAFDTPIKVKCRNAGGEWSCVRLDVDTARELSRLEPGA